MDDETGINLEGQSSFLKSLLLFLARIQTRDTVNLLRDEEMTGLLLQS